MGWREVPRARTRGAGAALSGSHVSVRFHQGRFCTPGSGSPSPQQVLAWGCSNLSPGPGGRRVCNHHLPRRRKRRQTQRSPSPPGWGSSLRACVFMGRQCERRREAACVPGAPSGSRLQPRTGPRVGVRAAGPLSGRRERAPGSPLDTHLAPSATGELLTGADKPPRARGSYPSVWKARPGRICHPVDDSVRYLEGAGFWRVGRALPRLVGVFGRSPGAPARGSPSPSGSPGSGRGPAAVPSRPGLLRTGLHNRKPARVCFVLFCCASSGPAGGEGRRQPESGGVSVRPRRQTRPSARGWGEPGVGVRAWRPSRGQMRAALPRARPPARPAGPQHLPGPRQPSPGLGRPPPPCPVLPTRCEASRASAGGGGASAEHPDPGRGRGWRVLPESQGAASVGAGLLSSRPPLQGKGPCVPPSRTPRASVSAPSLGRAGGGGVLEFAGRGAYRSSPQRACPLGCASGSIKYGLNAGGAPGDGWVTYEEETETQRL